MGIRSRLQRRKLIREFSFIPENKRVRPGIPQFLWGIGERIPLRGLNLTFIRRIRPAALLSRSGWPLGKRKRAPQRSIGIDIGRSHVRAVQMAHAPEGLRVERTFASQARRCTDSPAGILRLLTEEHGFDPRADVSVSLPHHVFFFADVRTDTAGVERFRAGDAAGLSNHFPIPPEDLITHLCCVSPANEGKRSLLIAAASCALLREQLKTLEEAGIKPVRMDAPMIAAHTAITANHPDAAKGLAIVLYVDESTLSLAVTQGAGILFVRNLPMFSCDTQDAPSLARQTAEIVAQEIEITWKRLFGKDPEPGLRVFLIASGRMADLLGPAVSGKIGCRVVPVDPCAEIANSAAQKADSSLCVAEGLALRALQPEGTDRTDFLAAYRARTQPRVRPRRELATCGGLAAAAVVMWVAGLFLQLSSLESHYARLKKEEETFFRRVAPEERTIVNPAAQLQQKLDALRKDCKLFTCFNPGRPGPMEVLLTLSRQVPATGSLRLHETLITGDSVRISGTCDSFGTFFDWQRLLENTPGLRLVDAPQPQKDSESQRVKFTISLSTTEKRRS